MAVQQCNLVKRFALPEFHGVEQTEDGYCAVVTDPLTGVRHELGTSADEEVAAAWRDLGVIKLLLEHGVPIDSTLPALLQPPQPGDPVLDDEYVEMLATYSWAGVAALLADSASMEEHGAGPSARTKVAPPAAAEPTENGSDCSQPPAFGQGQLTARRTSPDGSSHPAIAAAAGLRARPAADDQSEEAAATEPCGEATTPSPARSTQSGMDDEGGSANQGGAPAPSKGRNTRQFWRCVGPGSYCKQLPAKFHTRLMVPRTVKDGLWGERREVVGIVLADHTQLWTMACTQRHGTSFALQPAEVKAMAHALGLEVGDAITLTRCPDNPGTAVITVARAAAEPCPIDAVDTPQETRLPRPSPHTGQRRIDDFVSVSPGSAAKRPKVQQQQQQQQQAPEHAAGAAPSRPTQPLQSAGDAGGCRGGSVQQTAPTVVSELKEVLKRSGLQDGVSNTFLRLFINRCDAIQRTMHHEQLMEMATAAAAAGGRSGDICSWVLETIADFAARP